MLKNNCCVIVCRRIRLFASIPSKLSQVDSKQPNKTHIHTLRHHENAVYVFAKRHWYSSAASNTCKITSVEYSRGNQCARLYVLFVFFSHMYCRRSIFLLVARALHGNAADFNSICSDSERGSTQIEKSTLEMISHVCNRCARRTKVDFVWKNRSECERMSAFYYPNKFCVSSGWRQKQPTTLEFKTVTNVRSD